MPIDRDMSGWVWFVMEDESGPVCVASAADIVPATATRRVKSRSTQPRSNHVWLRKPLRCGSSL